MKKREQEEGEERHYIYPYLFMHTIVGFQLDRDARQAVKDAHIPFDLLQCK